MKNPNLTEAARGEEDDADPLRLFRGPIQRRREAVATPGLIDEERVQTLVDRVIERRQNARTGREDAPLVKAEGVAGFLRFLRRHRWTAMAATAAVAVLLAALFPRGDGDAPGAKAPVQVEFALIPAIRSGAPDQAGKDLSLALSAESVEIKLRGAVTLKGPPAVLRGNTLRVRASGRNEAGQPVEFSGEITGLVADSAGKLESIDWNQATLQGEFRVGTNDPIRLRFARFQPGR